MYDDEEKEEAPIKMFARVTSAMYVSIEEVLAIYAEPVVPNFVSLTDISNGKKPQQDWEVKFLFYGGSIVRVGKVFTSQETAEAFIHAILEDE